MKVLLITPPMVQINTPYPATPVLTGFLREQGVDAVQADLSLALALKLFSRDGVLKAAEAGAALAAPSAHLAAFLRDRALTLREAVNLLFIQTELLAQKLPFFAQFLLKAFAVMQSQRLAA